MDKLRTIGMATVLGGVIFALAAGCSNPVSPIPDEDVETEPPEDEPKGYVDPGSLPVGDLYVISDAEIPPR